MSPAFERRPGARGPLAGDHRQRLLDGMAAAIRTTGYARCTVGDIAREAGASRRTFYAHFTDLDACYLALFEQFAARNLKAVAAAVAASGSPRERLEGAVGSYLDTLAADPALASSFFRELHLTGEPGRRRLSAANRRAGETIRALAQAAGEAQPELGIVPITVTTARMLVAGIVQMALFALDGDGELDEVRDEATDLLTRVLFGAEEM